MGAAVLETVRPGVSLEALETAVPRKLWTCEEYQQLIADGFLQDGKVELVNGEIWEKMGQGRQHIIVVAWLIEVLGQIFGFRRIQSQSSLPTDRYGVPEPDIAVMAQTLDHYQTEEPTPADTLLIAEASDSTLHADLTAKARQYGSVGIPEYWVVDIPNRLLHVFREPIATGYASEIVLTTDDAISPLSALDSIVRVADLLP